MGLKSPAYYDDLLLNKLKLACFHELQHFRSPQTAECRHSEAAVPEGSASGSSTEGYGRHGSPTGGTSRAYPTSHGGTSAEFEQSFDDAMVELLGMASRSLSLVVGRTVFGLIHDNGGNAGPENDAAGPDGRGGSSHGSRVSGLSFHDRQRASERNGVRARPPQPPLPKPKISPFNAERFAEHLDPESENIKLLCRLMVLETAARFFKKQYDGRRHTASAQHAATAGDPEPRPDRFIPTREWSGFERQAAPSDAPRDGSLRSRPSDLHPPLMPRPAVTTSTVAEETIDIYEQLSARRRLPSLDARVNAINRSLARSLAARNAPAPNVESASGDTSEWQHIRSTLRTMRRLERDSHRRARLESDDEFHIDSDPDSSEDDADLPLGPADTHGRNAEDADRDLTDDDDEAGAVAAGGNDDGEGRAAGRVPSTLEPTRQDPAPIGAVNGVRSLGSDPEDVDARVEIELRADANADTREQAPMPVHGSRAPRIRLAFDRIRREVAFLKTYLEQRNEEQLYHEGDNGVTAVDAATGQRVPGMGAVRLDPLRSPLDGRAEGATSSTAPSRGTDSYVTSRHVASLRESLLKTLEAFDAAIGHAWVSGLLEEDADQQSWRLAGLDSERDPETSPIGRSRRTVEGIRRVGGMALNEHGEPILSGRPFERRREMHASWLRSSFWRMRSRAQALTAQADAISETFGGGLHHDAADIPANRQDEAQEPPVGQAAGSSTAVTVADGQRLLTEEEVAHRYFLACMERYRPANERRDDVPWRHRVAKWYYVDRCREQVPDPMQPSQGRPASRLASAMAETGWTPLAEDPYALMDLDRESEVVPVGDDPEPAWVHATIMEAGQHSSRDDHGISEALESNEVQYALMLLQDARERARRDTAQTTAEGTGDDGLATAAPSEATGPTAARTNATLQQHDGASHEGSEQAHRQQEQLPLPQVVDPDVSLTRTTSLTRRNAIRPISSHSPTTASSLAGERSLSHDERSDRASLPRGDLSQTLMADSMLSPDLPWAPSTTALPTGRPRRPAQTATNESALAAVSSLGSRARAAADRSRSRSFTFISTPAAVLGVRSSNGTSTTANGSDVTSNADTAGIGEARLGSTVLGRRAREDDQDQDQDHEFHAVRSRGSSPPLFDDLDGSGGGSEFRFELSDEVPASGTSTPQEARRATFEAYARRRRLQYPGRLSSTARDGAIDGRESEGGVDGDGVQSVGGEGEDRTLHELGRTEGMDHTVEVYMGGVADRAAEESGDSSDGEERLLARGLRAVPRGRASR